MEQLKLRWYVPVYKYRAWDRYEDAIIEKTQEYPSRLQYFEGGKWKDVPTVKERIKEYA